MTVTVTVAVTVAVVVMVIRRRPWNTQFCFLAHSDSLAGAGSMSNKNASGFRRPARRFPARGWVLAEQTCIARGSPVQTKLACVEMPFPLGVLQDGDRTAKACTQPIQTLQRGENLFHNSSPSFKDASCLRPEKTSITQVSRIAQSCTKLCVAASHSSSAPTATCNLFSSLGQIDGALHTAPPR